MFAWQTHASAALVRKVGCCLLPALLGAGGALLLLILAGSPARQVYADSLNFPGVCGVTIQACIDGANPGDTIVISAGDYTESLTLSKAVSLTGALSSTTILHALPNTRVLTVTGAAVDSSVVISGLTFTGGHTTTGCADGCDVAGCPGICGGGIFIGDGAVPILRSVRLMSNTTAAGGSGGGLSDTGTLYISDSSVMSNTGGNFGGGIFAQSAWLTETSAVNNHANQGGGLFATDAVTLSGAQLISNTAGLNGGAGYLLGAATLIDSDVMSNTASQSIGGLIVSEATVTGGLFQGNAGTALYGAAAVTLTGTRFVSNTNGSALYAGSTATISSVQFVGNSSYEGGGLYALHAITVTGSSFMSNTASSYGGGLFAADAVTMTDTQFVDNTALDGGGGMAAQSAQMTNSSFVHNSTGGIGGGGLDIFSDVTLSNTSFVNNTGTEGGGLYVSNAANVTDAQFVSNTSYYDGGGLKVIGPATLSQASFVSNTAGSQGGGLIAFDAITLTDAQFVSNTAGASGGGVYFADFGVPTQHRLVNSLLAGNSAGGLGDDLYVDLPASSATILHTTFAAPGHATGSAVVVVSGTVGITNSIFSSHTVGISLTAGSVFQDYNLFFGNGEDVSGTVGGGAHSLTGDPLFVSPAGGPSGYHLSAGSLAVDAGTDAGVATDFEGDPRPQGNGFDIGFDESPFTAIANVGVTKSASASQRQPGQALTYTLVYSNAGPDIAPGVQLTDIVPANLVNVTYTSSGAALTPVGLSAFEWQVANLSPGAGGMVTVTGVLSGGPAGSVFTNSASITTAYSDTNPANNTAAVTVTVANVAPVAADDSYLTAQSHSLMVSAPGVLTNDSDGNNDALTATLSLGPLTGTLSLQADGSFTFTPPLGFGGVVTFSYQASDGLLLSAPATVTITVNQPPVSDAGPGQVKIVGAPVTLDGSASNDPDHNLPLAYGWHQAGGTAVVLSSTAISRPTFTAPATPAVLTFTLTVSDALGLASLPATTTVTVTDQAITGLSAAGGSPRFIGSSTPFTATISAGTNVTYAWGFGDGSAPASGALVSHTYALPGVYHAVVTATNSVGLITATTTVSVTDHAITGLSAANSSPTLPGHATILAASITSGTNVTFTWGFGDGATGAGLTTTHTYAGLGFYPAVVTATNSLGSLTATTTVAVDDVPLAAGDAYGTTQNAALHVAAPGVLANDSDAFPGGLTAHLLSGPTNGTLVLAPSGAFTYTPPIGFSGLVTFTYRAGDGLLFSPPTMVSIIVSAFKLYLPLVLR